MDNDPQPRKIRDPHFTTHSLGEILDAARHATRALHPEARVPETAMPKWTPGPWTYRQSIETVSGASYPIAKIRVPRTGDELRANGHLIAAAPELYAELDNARAIIAGEAPQYGEALKRIDAILRKARGAP